MKMFIFHANITRACTAKQQFSDGKNHTSSHAVCQGVVRILTQVLYDFFDHGISTDWTHDNPHILLPHKHKQKTASTQRVLQQHILEQWSDFMSV